VPPYLRHRSRGCENACHHATKENEFSPVHSVTGFQRLKPAGIKSCGTGKGNLRVTIAPPLQRLWQQKEQHKQQAGQAASQQNVQALQTAY
jgi:hypothetical protein